MHPLIQDVHELTKILNTAPVMPNKLTYNLPDQLVEVNGQNYHSCTVTFVRENDKGHIVGLVVIKDEIIGITYDKGYEQWVKYNGKRVYDEEEYDWNP